MEKFDIIVVGSGPGGYVAAIRAAQLGKFVAIIERAEIGGVCLNWGCIPTKALLKSAQAYTYAKHAVDYGFEIEGNLKADINKMVARSRNVSAQMSRGVEFLLKKNKIALIHGEASLKSNHELNVILSHSGKRVIYSADHIIFATGSRPNSLPFAPIDEEKIISYRKALIPDKLPRTLAVIGSGAIGSEFAFFYRSLGVEVCLIEYLDRVLPLEDDDVCSQISRSFRKMGIKVMVSAQVKSVDTSGDVCRLSVETKRGLEIVEADVVLSAVGVKPNTDFLNFDKIGVKIERGKVVVDKYYRTNVEGIYAIGDIIDTPALAHVASAEGICCVNAIAGLNPMLVNYDAIPACTYINPEVASVGLTERAAKEKGIDYKIGKFFFLASGKAVAAGEKDGFVKFIVDSVTDKIIGAHLVGANVTEMISGIVMGMNMGFKVKDIINSVYPHPTMSEAIMEAAEAAHGQSIHQ